MEQKISISERALEALLKSKEALIEDAKLKGYNPLRLSSIALSSSQWWKNITKMAVYFLMVFVLSPKGMFLDLKEGRIKSFFVKAFILFCFSIPFTLAFFLFSLFALIEVVILIYTLISPLF